MPHNVLIIGLGKIGMEYDIKYDENHILSHSRAFDSHEDFKIVAGVDVDLEKCSLFNLKYNVKTYSSLHLAMDEVDASIFVISTSTESHHKVINQIFDITSPLVILCEKPICYGLEDAKNIIARCKENNSTLYVNYMRSADIGVRGILDRLQDSRILMPIRGVVWYSKGLFNSASHFINMLGIMFRSVAKIIVTDKGRMWNENDPEPDFKLIFNNVEIDFIAVKEENYFHNTMEWIAANGRLRYERGGAIISWENISDEGLFSGYTVLDEKIELLKSDFNRIQWHVTDQISRSIKGEKVTMCTGEDALKTLEVCDEIRERCYGSSKY